MGEYAIRKHDSQEIKIGTCEDMYYLRFEDRNKVRALEGNVNPNLDDEANGLRFRLPFPDEDEIAPGEYKEYNRSLRLYKTVPATTIYGQDSYKEFQDASTCKDPGTIQLRHESSGLLINVPCFHGHKLPDLGPNVSVFWNGKGHSLVLSSLKAVKMADELHIFPVIRCRHCNQAWRYEWSEIVDFIPEPMRTRLSVYMPAPYRIAG